VLVPVPPGCLPDWAMGHGHGPDGTAVGLLLRICAITAGR
jgi:hypothetical protein